MKMYIYALLSLFSVASLTAVPEEQAKPCQCYCSGICKPRDVGEKPGDNPKIDRKTGICFCQKWDKNNFGKCNLSPEEAREALEKTGNSCCASKAEKPAHRMPAKRHHYRKVMKEAAPVYEEGRPMYQCPRDRTLYAHLAEAQAVCGDKVKEAYYYDRPEYRVSDDDDYYYVYDYRPGGVVGDVVEDAHEVASDIWHGIGGIFG